MLVKGQLKVASLEGKSSDPDPRGPGYVYFNTTTRRPMVDRYITTGELNGCVWSGSTLTRASGSFIDDGFDSKGQQEVLIAGSDLNNGTKTTESVTALVMTFTAAINNDANDDGMSVTLNNPTDWFPNDYYDYIVPQGDSQALIDAITNNGNSYKSIYIPNGYYDLGSDSHIIGPFVSKVTGESIDGTVLTSSRDSSTDSVFYAALPPTSPLYMTFERFTLQNSVDDNDTKAFYAVYSFWLIRNIKILNFNVSIAGLGISAKDIYATLSSKVCATGNFNNLLNSENIVVDCPNQANETFVFYGCSNLKNCTVTLGSPTATIVSSFSGGFYNCVCLSNCKVIQNENVTVASGATWRISGFNFCYALSQCSFEADFTGHNSTNGIEVAGFYNCAAMSNCKSTIDATLTKTAGSANAYSFTSCGAISGCVADHTGTSATDNDICFNTINGITGCIATASGAGTACFNTITASSSNTHVTGTTASITWAGGNSYADDANP